MSARFSKNMETDETKKFRDHQSKDAETKRNYEKLAREKHKREQEEAAKKMAEKKSPMLPPPVPVPSASAAPDKESSTPPRRATARMSTAGGRPRSKLRASALAVPRFSEKCLPTKVSNSQPSSKSSSAAPPPSPSTTSQSAPPTTTPIIEKPPVIPVIDLEAPSSTTPTTSSNPTPSRKAAPAIASHFPSESKAQLLKTVQEQADKMRKINVRLTELEAQNTNQQKTVKVLGETIGKKDKELMELAKDLKALDYYRDEFENLTKVNNDLINQKQALEKQISLLNERIRTLENAKEEKQALEKELKSANVTIGSLKAENSTYLSSWNAEKKQRASDNEEYHVQMKLLQEKMKESENNYEARLSRLAKNNGCLYSENESMKVENEQLTKAKCGLESRIKILESEISKILNETASQKNRIEELMDEKTGFEKNAELSKKQIQNADQEKKKVEILLIKKDEIISKLTEDAKILQMQLQEVKLENGKNISLVEEGKERLELLKQSLDAKDHAIAQLNKQVEDLEEEKACLSNRLKNTEEVKSQSLTDAERIKQQILEEAGKEKEKFEQSMSERNETISKLNNEILALGKQSEELKRKEESALNRLSESKESNSQLANNVQSLQNQMEKLKMESERKIILLEEEINRLKESLNAKEDLNSKLTREIKSLKNKVLEAEKEKIPISLCAEEKESREFSKEADLLNKRIEEAQKEIENLKKSNEEKDLVILGMSEKAKSFEKGMKEEKDILEKRAEQAEREMDCFKNKLNEKEEIISNMNSAAMEMAESKRSLEAEIAKLRQEFVPCLSSPATLTNLGVEEENEVVVDDHYHHHHSLQDSNLFEIPASEALPTATAAAAANKVNEGGKGIANVHDDYDEDEDNNGSNLSHAVPSSLVGCPSSSLIPPIPSTSTSSSKADENKSLKARLLLVEEQLNKLTARIEQEGKMVVPSTSSASCSSSKLGNVEKSSSKTKTKKILKDKKNEKAKKNLNKLQEKGIGKKRKRRTGKKRASKKTESSSSEDDGERTDGESSSSSSRGSNGKPEKKKSKRNDKFKGERNETTYATGAAQLEFLKVNSRQNFVGTKDYRRFRFCDVCKRGYSTKANLTAHIKGAHMPKVNDVALQCKLCNHHQFSNKSNFRVHMKKFHNASDTEDDTEDDKLDE